MGPSGREPQGLPGWAIGLMITVAVIVVLGGLCVAALSGATY